MARLSRFPRTRSTWDLQQEVNDLFDQFFPNRQQRGENEEEYTTGVWRPRVDIAETPDAHIIRMDLPGVSKEDVEVTIDNAVLKVSGERRMSRREKESEFSRIERSYGRFFRSFRLGSEAIDAEAVEATHENGVLTIRLPKTAKSRTRQIEIS